MMGGRRKLHNKELLDLYSSSIIRIIKLRRQRYGGGHLAQMERRGTYIGYW
jgi:hypothetical protein